MAPTHTENRKLPAWIGSILLHAFLLLCLLLWFSVPSVSDRGVPGERIAVGSIVLQPSGGGEQRTEPQDEPQEAPAESILTELEQFTDINLSVLPITPALSPGQHQQVSQPATASATDLAEALQPSVLTGRSVGNQTGETTASVFGTSGTGSKFMYVFDRSGSMEGTPMQAAKTELIRSLEGFDDRHQFNIIFYSGRNSWQLWQPGRRLFFATEANKQNAIRFVSGIIADGGTRHFEPLMEAIAHRPDVIFFLTDGDPQDDLTDAELSSIDRANSRFGRGAQINVIQFGDGSFTNSRSRSLQRLAEQNFGEYQYVNVTVLQYR